jgi:mannose/fructose-specific phosphotransferase system component IIA
LKALIGDEDVEVIAECFSGLLSARSETAVDFVAHFVDSDDSEVSEVAILALGASRLPKAIELLKEKWQLAVQSGAKKTILLALATSRDEAALSFLIAQVNEASVQTAAEIITALAVHKNSDRIRQLVSEAVDQRRERALLDAFRREFTE